MFLEFINKNYYNSSSFKLSWINFLDTDQNKQDGMGLNCFVHGHSMKLEVVALNHMEIVIYNIWRQ